jgi:cystathionine beta-lyase/cystathionine gamma-synthase
MKDRPRHLDTVCAHGVRADAPAEHPSAEPLYQTSVFDFPSIEATDAPLDGRGGYVYARHGLPNARSLELTIAALEGAEDALATSAGMSAIACAALAVARAGDRLLVQRDAYGGSIALFKTDLARLGIAVDAVDAYDPDAVARALERPAAALLVESIANPLAREVDVPALAARCRGKTVLIVDNTFATPIFQRPLAEGAGVVMHSVTKFLGGHHDLAAGVLAGPAAFIKDARGVARRFGMTAAPFDAWLASRGIRTLAVRMERAQATARDLAARLRSHPDVRAVHYPGRSAILAFELADGPAAARAIERMKLITLTPSLGGTTTTASHSASSSHRLHSPEERRALGISDGLLRLSIGLEAPDDIWADLTGAVAR